MVLDNSSQKNPLSAKKIVLFLVYALIAVCLFFTVLSFNDLPGIMEKLASANPVYILLGACMLLVYMALYPLSLCILTKARGCKISGKLTYSIAMTEFFFNGITPLATGGQPFQAHSFSRAKVKIGESTGLLLTNLIIYMIVTTGFSLLGLFYFEELTAHIDPAFIPVIVIGYALNFSMMVIMIALGTSKGLRNALLRMIRFFGKFRLLAFLKSKEAGAKEYFTQVQEAFSDLMKHKKECLLAVLTKIAAFVFFYGSTFFALLALGIPVNFSHFFMVLCGTSFAITAVGFIPTPGASGSTEGSACQVFKCIIMFLIGEKIVTEAIELDASSVMLIWRLLSYYLVMVISLIFVVSNEIYFSKKAKKERLSAKR